EVDVEEYANSRDWCREHDGDLIAAEKEMLPSTLVASGAQTAERVKFVRDDATGERPERTRCEIISKAVEAATIGNDLTVGPGCVLFDNDRAARHRRIECRGTGKAHHGRIGRIR